MYIQSLKYQPFGIVQQTLVSATLPPFFFVNTAWADQKGLCSSITFTVAMQDKNHLLSPTPRRPFSLLPHARCRKNVFSTSEIPPHAGILGDPVEIGCGCGGDASGGLDAVVRSRDLQPSARDRHRANHALGALERRGGALPCPQRLAGKKPQERGLRRWGVGSR